MAPAKSPRFRIERDTLGEVSVPRDALYGAQTQRAVENFPVSGLRSHPAFIRAYILIKKAAAISNHELGVLDRKTAAAISDAADQILGPESTLSFSKALAASRRRHDVRGSRTREDDVRAVPWLVPPDYIAAEHRGEFVVDVFQAGAGTSFNMNCNEVLANLATRALGAKPGNNPPVHPNDHVNMSQSTNDTFPTATRLATLLLLRELFPALDGLAFALDRKGEDFADVIKSGRTHLQDAVPVTLGQEFAAWGAAVRRATDLLESAAGQLRQLGIGGTATGTGINTPAGFRHQIVRNLSIATGLELESQADLREAMQSQLPIGAVMSALRSLALELTRITNDIRLLASGPLTGLGELILPAVQPGSSIMPGKVNPSMLECMNQICFHVIGAAAAVDYAMQAGQLELNVMMPLMAFEVLFSIEILKNYVPVFVDRCITGIEADREQSEAYYISSPALATALNPLIGYARAAEIAKEAAKTRRPIPDLLRERKLISEEQIREIFSPGFLTGGAEAEPAPAPEKRMPASGKRPAKRR